MALGALDGFRKASILGNVASCHPSPTQVFIDRQAALDAVSAAAARTSHAAADAAATTGFRKEPATRPANGQPACSAGSTQAQEGKSILFILINNYNWKRLVLIALCIGSKIWDDDSLENVHFPKVMADVNLKMINRLEQIFLDFLSYDLAVKGRDRKSVV